ncbi:hypothetical protein AB0894_11730 [Streptomyces sp. NPDC047916]|uniref:hypothetical protein n=1 Tax=Streptomyces sp. NPDC047916 TaxID=3156681 RepID=UPI0034526129
MTDRETKPSAARATAGVIATALCAVLLLMLHTVGGYFLLNALLAESEGPWDSTVTDTVRALALLAIAIELSAAAATAAFVALVRLRRWWYLIPAALIPVAITRMVFAPTP